MGGYECGCAAEVDLDVDSSPPPHTSRPPLDVQLRTDEQDQQQNSGSSAAVTADHGLRMTASSEPTDVVELRVVVGCVTVLALGAFGLVRQGRVWGKRRLGGLGM